MNNCKLKFTVVPDRLEFRFPFHIAHGVRTGTDVVFLIVECDGYRAFGEATLPPYLSDTIESTKQFFEHPSVKSIEWPFHPVDVFDHLNALIPGCMPAKAALDMALWQLYASRKNLTISSALGFNPNQQNPPHCFTIDVSDRETMIKKFEFARQHGFEFFKLKLNGKSDDQMINDYLSLSNFPFAIDANQSWNDWDTALNMTSELIREGCLFIEQPFIKEDVLWTKKLIDETNAIIMADEAFQIAEDFMRISSSFNAINIKLQKCGGLTPAVRILRHATESGLHVMIGCMSESSVGCDAGEVIAPFCKWADLDGPYLIKNNQEIRSRLDRI
jgi:L-alanine-DL-glutamate epimerase-like enolase superfamily enzyme